MVLYDYFRSTAAWRVRIALALKGVSVERRFVHLLRGGGEQKTPAYLEVNPAGLVPALALDDGTVLTQSLAIIEYLDTLSPESKVIPPEPVLAARTRAVALAIACDIHPLGNLRIGAYLENDLGHNAAEILAWRRHWIAAGFAAIETMIDPAPFCFGAAPTIADICLVPQLFNAARFGVAMDSYPKIRAVGMACSGHPAFCETHPDVQPDRQETSPAP